MKGTENNLDAIARRVGVSRSTVSRALRDHPAISAATVAKVKETAANLGYRTNPIVTGVMRRMRHGGSQTEIGTLAYLTSEATSNGWRKYATYVQFYEGARMGAEARGFRLDELWIHPKVMPPRRLMKIFEARNIQGVLFGPTVGKPFWPTADWSGFSVVKIGAPIEGLTTSSVAHNFASGMLLALEKLKAAGYRRPALILESHQSEKMGGAWLAAFVGAQQTRPSTNRIPPLVERHLTGDRVRDWFAKHRPDAIIGLRAEIIKWLGEASVSVPRDVGFVHLDCSPGNKVFSGIDQHSFFVGKTAVDLLLNHLLENEHGFPLLAHSLLIDGSWKEGTTTPPVTG